MLVELNRDEEARGEHADRRHQQGAGEDLGRLIAPVAEVARSPEHRP
jgi:hypothetical protein